MAIEHGQTSLEELQTELEKYSAAECRLSLQQMDDATWQVRNMIVDIPPPPIELSWQSHNYGSMCFVREIIGGAALSSWLRDREGQSQGLRFQFAEFYSQIQWGRYGSQSKMNPLDAIPLPYSTYEIRPHTSQQQDNRGAFVPLVKTGCPSFPDYSTAVHHFLYDSRKMKPDVQREVLLVRIAHSEAWIDSVVLDCNQIEIDLKGTDVAGTRLVIGIDNSVRSDDLLTTAGRVRIDLGDGSLDRVWLVLSREDKWLDSRDFHRSDRESVWNNVDLRWKGRSGES